ncbi:DEAD/DEAH box helicase [Thalassotalea atypica]|uniref:DEAD/DEAH box helicase n=1 Tax=Thalassotalea atypica TaxID=2054316 RepID=UPI0025728A5A|nr:DEAD/DEAH box helicase [Thalassotalea atypica]
MAFSSLGLSQKILDAIQEQGYDKPSPIQEQAIPKILAGRDILAAAQTGTGKTAGFTLPILQKLYESSKHKSVKGNHTQVLILTPTRELAAQIQDSIVKYSKHIPVTSDVVFGGIKINPQMLRLRKGVDILVATPGRLLDLYQQNAIKFQQLHTLVLDEADRMLDMGFSRDINKILALLPKKRQTLLFSATFSPEIRELAKGVVHNPSEVSVTPENSTAATIEHWLVAADKKRKPALLHHLITTEKWQQVLVFTRTKHGANKLTRYLESEGHKAAAIHGNKSQGARTKALAGFKSKDISILVATDIAARGIDISQLPQVVNFDLPNVQEDYVHRIGRTGRAGVNGQAVSLVSADEYDQLVDIEYVIQQHIPRREIAKFTPMNPLAESRAIKPFKAKKPKKPKAPKVEHKDGQKSGDNAKGHKPKSKNPRHRVNSGGNNASGNKTNSSQKRRSGNSSQPNKSGNRKPSPYQNS